MPVAKGGLEDVIAGQSEICFIDGKEGRLLYRGYDITDLAEHATFEEVAYLLWYGRLPNRAELDRITSDLARNRAVPAEVLDLVRRAPRASHAMAVLRSAVSQLGVLDPEADDDSREANLRKAVRLVAQTGTLVAAIGRVRQGQEPIAPNPDLGLAADFLRMLTGREPSPEDARIFDVCLILHADHELNASTFAARVTCATLADIYSAVTSAIGALKGPLHGGANENVMKMLHEIGSVDRVEPWLENALANKVKVPGFGHRVYKTEDPRATILRRYSKELGERRGETKWYEMLVRLQALMQEKKGLYPNVDLYSGSVYDALGIPMEIYTPIFAFSRMSGWTAHVLEQYSDNRIIRPRAEYVGPSRQDWVPLDRR